jgi:hypothetical protein
MTRKGHVRFWRRVVFVRKWLSLTTWGRAGNLFDFVCLYYQITPQEAWQRVQRGEW